MDARLQALADEVKKNTDVTESAVLVIKGLADKVAALSQQPADTIAADAKSLADEIHAESQKLADAVAANTPAPAAPAGQ